MISTLSTLWRSFRQLPRPIPTLPFPLSRAASQSTTSLSQPQASASPTPSPRPRRRRHRQWKPPPDLKYPVRPIPSEARTPSGFVHRLGGYDHLPFRVERTGKSQQLPVYRDYRGHDRVFTVLRHVRGDVRELATDMSKVCDNAPVDVRPGPRLVVVGDHVRDVRYWLLGLGF